MMFYGLKKKNLPHPYTMVAIALPIPALTAQHNKESPNISSKGNDKMTVSSTSLFNKVAVALTQEIDYLALCEQTPQVVSLSFYRDPQELPKRRLGFRLDKTLDEQAQGGGDLRIAEVDTSPETLLGSMACQGVVEVGDILVGFNDIACYSNHFDAEMISKATGLTTLHIRKTTFAPLQDELRQAIFFQPRQHTCIPMAIELQVAKEEISGKPLLTIAQMDENNPWLKGSCLEDKLRVVVLSINDVPSFELEEQDATLFLQTKGDSAGYISIKTFSKKPTFTTAGLYYKQKNQRWKLGDRVWGRRRKQGGVEFDDRKGSYFCDL